MYNTIIHIQMHNTIYSVSGQKIYQVVTKNKYIVLPVQYRGDPSLRGPKDLQSCWWFVFTICFGAQFRSRAPKPTQNWTYRYKHWTTNSLVTGVCELTASPSSSAGPCQTTIYIQFPITSDTFLFPEFYISDVERIRTSFERLKVLAFQQMNMEIDIVYGRWKLLILPMADEKW